MVSVRCSSFPFDRSSLILFLLALSFGSVVPVAESSKSSGLVDKIMEMTEKIQTSQSQLEKVRRETPRLLFVASSSLTSARFLFLHPRSTPPPRLLPSVSRTSRHLNIPLNSRRPLSSFPLPGKRKREDSESDLVVVVEDEALPIASSSTSTQTLSLPSPTQAQTSVQTTTTAVVESPTVVAEQPPRKKSRIGSFFLGALTGSVATLGMLAAYGWNEEMAIGE